MGKVKVATSDEILAAVRILHRSAEENDGVPAWTACEKSSGWSRRQIQRWYKEHSIAPKRAPDPPPQRPAPRRTNLSVKPGGKVAQLPPPPAEEVDDTPTARAVPPPTWGDLDEADYCLRELDTLWRLREGARMAEQYSATAPLTDRIDKAWRALRAEIAKRAERTGRTPEQVRADLIDRAAKMSDTLLEPFVVEWRRRHGGAA
jgi:hypothetical protein